MPTPSHPPPPEAEIPKVKIYFLPNLLTAGNLACGFVALTKIVEADISDGDFTKIKVALMYIGLAFLFDLFDGRVARMGGRESPFGREFDSLADLISFGVAPAFLIHRIVLKDVFVARPEIGWFIASIYVICGAFRLARFNCIAAMSGGGGGKEFLGFPIPSAAGLVGSIAYFLIRWEERDFPQKWWRYTLPVLMLFLSWMMVSILFIGGVVILQEKLLTLFLPLFFTCYLIYGFIRPRISHRVREEIEEEEEEDEHLVV
jgi:CDP-diacylglycerol--serine O-phosphatidyltransferase